MPKFKKGHIPWCKGTKGLVKSWNKGKKLKPLTEEHKKKIGEKLSGENNPLYGKHHNKKTIEKLRRANLGKHFSPETEFKKGNNGYWLGKKRFNMSGENHPRWKGGIDLENKRIRDSLEYTIWRNEIYRRDNWTCRLCGKHCLRGNIVAHHLELFSEFPELRYEVNNGITLCRSCHVIIHKPRLKNL